MTKIFLPHIQMILGMTFEFKYILGVNQGPIRDRFTQKTEVENLQIKCTFNKLKIIAVQIISTTCKLSPCI